jgi:hypothetical protein
MSATYDFYRGPVDPAATYRAVGVLPDGATVSVPVPGRGPRGPGHIDATAALQQAHPGASVVHTERAT